MMRLIIVAGAPGIIMLWSWPAAAERRSESYQFCQGAPDLCVFVCRDGCPGMSTDYVCESRRGRLVVDEGGSRSYYEDDFSLCWHRSRPVDLPVPDPEHDNVPGWPGSEEGAMCIGCKTQLNTCRAFVDAGEETCVELHETRARNKCTVPWSEGKRPRDRFGRPFEPSDSHCANVLQMDDALNDVDEDFDTDPQTRKRLRQARKKCERKLTEECIEHFRVSSGSETEGSSRGVEVNARDFFGASYDGNDSVTWGGSKGFLEACGDLAKIAADACVGKWTDCARKASPNKPCSSRGRR